MKIEVEIPEYSIERGLPWISEPGYRIQTFCRHEVITIQANRAGLIFLARQLLAMSQSSVPVGYHVHYDSMTSLEADSMELIIEKSVKWEE